jgi:hypothetical protein
MHLWARQLKNQRKLAFKVFGFVLLLAIALGESGCGGEKPPKKTFAKPKKRTRLSPPPKPVPPAKPNPPPKPPPPNR